MRIVVDVMGGDHGCEVVIEGVKIALQAYDKISELHLVGDEAQIRAAMAQARGRLPRGRARVAGLALAPAGDARRATRPPWRGRPHRAEATAATRP